MKLGVDVLPKFTKDNTDRNRTSQFAFTGNKFEFRMVGSADSIACANIMLNSAVAESLRVYADYLEQAPDFQSALQEMLKNTIKEHKRIIFNGNGYDDAWIQEATLKRGLSNYPSTPDCVPHILDRKNVELLTGQKIYTEPELRARYEIVLENYCKSIVIEANTMVDMAGNYTAYMTDMTRVFSVGRLPELAYRAHQTAFLIESEIENIARPGTPCAELYEIAAKITEKQGLGAYFMGTKQQAKFVGHGIGIQINELPVLTPRSKDRLEPNMVFALEPKYVIPGVGAVGIENSFLVTETGLEKITQFTEDIIQL